MGIKTIPNFTKYIFINNIQILISSHLLILFNKNKSLNLLAQHEIRLNFLFIIKIILVQ